MSYILPKGKYKGTSAEDVVDKFHDRGYLEWVLNNWELQRSEQIAIEQAMNPSRELFKPAVGTKYITEDEVRKAAEFLIRRVGAFQTSLQVIPEQAPNMLASKVIKEMYRMLTGKDYVN